MWSRRWAAYLLACLGGFAVLEYLGIRSRRRGGPNGTLTCALRRWLHIDPVGPRRRLGQAALVAVLAWFGLHIVTGRWP
ncbi:hypothetical protein [Saccharothrix variisporea]|uniref:Uncharacterized protein n=1 Tax=Saccharothrix variisporea TaxID=543527 RepID=A0A495X6H5_9PSEU|nr:hypothetical protein [Saccharothrix variisporea]RKT67098.1 hypothetical protein DFJ66_0266 [Saccharothrix variisporea]